jgi:hypothetical protein
LIENELASGEADLDFGANADMVVQPADPSPSRFTEMA